MTRIWRFVEEPSALQTTEMARTLDGGGVLILPTDTIYGLHARATDDAAVDRIAAIKGREDTKPFIVLAASIEQLPLLGIAPAPGHLEALREIWPAPLTAIVPIERPVAASRGADTLAVRIPSLPWLRALLARTGPLVSTSVNRAGELPLRSPAELARPLHDAVDGIADSGALTGAPSAILDLTSGEPRFIREGENLFTQKVWKTLRKTL